MYSAVLYRLVTTPILVANYAYPKYLTTIRYAYGPPARSRYNYMRNKLVSTYAAQFSILRIAQNALHITVWQTFSIETISASLGSN